MTEVQMQAEHQDGPNSSPVDRRAGVLASIAIIGAMLALSAWAWAQLPDDAAIPVHWGIGGSADRYGGKFEALLLVPIIATVLAGLLAALPGVEPRREHLAQSARAYTTVWIAVLLVMATTHVSIVLSALGIPMSPVTGIPFAIGLLFLLLGSQLRDVHSNYFFGIRTPWTLSSELSWQRTHELSGRMFIGLGLALMVLAIVGQPVLTFAVVMLGVLGIVAFTFVYSYRVWKTDPERERVG
jgi:uncharacterized membrane protein